MLSGVWTGQNPSGRWMSEKFDGVRAGWDGRTLWSRGSNAFLPPAWWLAMLPAGVALDGELWMGYRKYDTTMAATKCRTPSDEVWRKMQFIVFDAPEHGGSFEARQEFLFTLSLPSFVRLAPQTICRGLGHLKRALREVHSRGGEGLMLREPGSLYVGERSNTLLKVRCANNSELLRAAPSPAA